MNRPIRVLQVITAFGDDAPSQGAAALAKYLARDAFQATAVSLRCLPETRSSTMRDLKRAGIAHCCMKMNGFLDCSIFLRLIRLMRQVRPDIVHTHAFRADLWAGLAAKVAKVPLFVSSIRNNEWECFRTEQPFLVAQLAILTSKFATALSDALVAVSEGVREHLVSVQGIPLSKIHVILNGVDLERLARCDTDPRRVRADLGFEREDLLVGTLAAFKPRKGLGYLVEAAREVVSRHPHTHFLLAGDGPERGAIEEQVHRIGLEAHVHLLGYREDGPAVLNAIDIFVLPSLFEGLPRSLLEAMALEKPVVVTNIGGSREVVRPHDSGLVVPPRDSKRLADAICTLAESAELRRGMGRAGRQVVEHQFDARANALAHEKLYRELLETRGNPV